MAGLFGEPALGHGHAILPEHPSLENPATASPSPRGTGESGEAMGGDFWCGPSALVGSLGVGRGWEGPLQSILTPNPSAGLFAGLDEAGLNRFNF